MIQLRFASTHGWLRIRGAASALGADIHFYASSQCNSMLTLIGAIPYTDASTAAAAGRSARVTLFAELRLQSG